MVTSCNTASAATTNYNGTFTGGGSNTFIGCWFTVSGFTKPTNNGTFYNVASATTSITLDNPQGWLETAMASALQMSYITLRVPVGATLLSLGINDTDLHDNTGSFTLNATVTDAIGFTGSAYPFAHYPVGPSAIPQPAFGGELIPIGQVPAGGNFARDWQGQLFPRGKN